MKFLLTAAGLKNEAIREALQTLVGKPFAETRVLFVTTAANTGSDDKRWLLDNLNEFSEAGVASLDIIDIAGLPREVWFPHAERADVICVGGGDERYLARIFAEQHFKEELMPLLAKRVYMGISAGGMVVGHFLPATLSSQIFIEEDFGNTEGEGLGLVPFAYIPHLNSNFFSLRKERLDSLQQQFTFEVHATDDETALLVVDGVVSKVGDGEWLTYEASAKM